MSGVLPFYSNRSQIGYVYLEDQTMKASTVGNKIGIAPEKWVGRCHEISSMLLKKNVVKGRLHYGHWRGPIHQDSHFAKRAHLGWCQHGWIELADGRICDPTRWVFESVDPYIYIGPNDHYDAGGNMLLKELMEAPPDFDSTKPTERLKLEGEVDCELLGCEKQHPEYNLKQISWLGNLPLRILGDHAKAVYTAISETRPYAKAFIPIDNWKMIMEER